MQIGDKNPTTHLNNPCDLMIALGDYLGIKIPTSQPKVHAVATDALMPTQDGFAVAQPMGNVLSSRSIEPISAVHTAGVLHAYLDARGRIPAHDHLAILLYDLLNHTALPEEHRPLYRPVACDIGSGNIAMGFATEQAAFTLSQEVLLQQQSQAVSAALNALIATPATPAQTQQLLAQVASNHAQPITAQQLAQALTLALTAIASFSVAVKDLRKANEKQLKSTFSQQATTESVSPKEPPSKTNPSQKPASGRAPEAAPSPKYEKKKAKELEKAIESERQLKRNERKHQRMDEITAHEKKVFEIKQESLPE
jgi:hypothetical protein